MFRHFRSRELVVLLSSLAAIGAVTVGLRALPDVSPTTAALALLLVVLGAATLARLRTAIVVSLIAMLTLNFFFLPPVGTFTIVDPQNWIALFAFLVVAVIASNLSAAAQDRARDAIARRNEVTRLFDLTRDVLLTTQTAGAIEILARHVARRFELARIAICLPADHGWRIHQGGSEEVVLDVAMLNTAFAKARGTLEFDARQRAYGGHVRVGERNDVLIVPLRHGTRAVGLLAAATSTLDIGTLDAVAGVVAIAIARRHDRAVGWLGLGLLWSSVFLSVAAPSLASVVPGLPNDHYHAFADPMVVVLVGLGLAALVAAPGPIGPAAAGVTLVAILGWNLTHQPPSVHPDGGWPAGETAGARVDAVLGEAGIGREATVLLRSIPDFKSTEAVAYPLVRAGQAVIAETPRDIAPGSADPEADPRALVLLCDDLFADANGAACGGPAEAGMTPDDGATGRWGPLLDRFEAHPGRWISVYGPGG